MSARRLGLPPRFGSDRMFYRNDANEKEKGEEENVKVVPCTMDRRGAIAGPRGMRSGDDASRNARATNGCTANGSTANGCAATYLRSGKQFVLGSFQ